jgi:hypothetical protein
MNDEDQKRIIRAAERCESSLELEALYFEAQDFESAARYAHSAETDSYIAFTTADCASYISFVEVLESRA